MTTNQVSTQLGNHQLMIETGRMARQAHGAVTVRYGDTMILATVVSNHEADKERDFFPLTVDYREKTYAAGKIPGGYFKREGRPSEKETLTARLIDRPIRSVFDKGYKNETQILVSVISSDCENDSDVLAINGASAALMISDAPFEDPIGAVRVGLIDGALVINPTFTDLEKSDLDLVVAGTSDKVVMIEAGANEVSEEKLMEAIRFGHEEVKKLTAAQKELRAKAGRPKREIVKSEMTLEIVEKIRQASAGEFERIFTLPTKEEREHDVRVLYEEKVLKQFDTAAEDFNEGAVKSAFEDIEKEFVRNMILRENKRPDGRAFRDIRPITIELAVLPRAHGSSLFTRGQTQSLSAATLGTGEDEQIIDALEGELSKTFMLHYNFPPFSVGETGRVGGTGRREIGHGALAERSLKPVMPSEENFPYTVRLVSDILESNGSSSMATVCGGTLALMDAGVPIKAPVAGIAIGLVTNEQGDWKVLTDIAGIEDHLGDMDFKAAGTRKGITALQMDLKIKGVTEDIMKEAFDQAKAARFKILDLISQAIEGPRKELSVYAPRIITLQINPEKIGAVIGPGGKIIRRITEETGVKIDIEDDGKIFIASTDAKAAEIAIAQIQGITAEPEVGKIYTGKVQKLVSFGAFCEILPGKDGLCHVSEVSEGFVKDVTDYLRVGDTVPVKVVSVDPMGKVSLSIKQAQEGGMPPLPPGAPRDKIDEIPRGGGRDRGRPRSRR